MALPPSSSASSLSAASAQPTPLHLHLTSRAPGRLPLLHFSRAALPPPLRARIPRTNLPAAPGKPLHRALPAPPSASASSSSSIAGGGFGSDEADDGHNHHGGDGGEGGGDDGGHNDNGDEGGADESPGDARGEALFVLAQLGRKLDTLPSDLAAAIESGRIGGDIVSRFSELEANGFIKWLLQFEGFRERLLADELFLTKLGIECGIGLVAKTAAELQKRGDNFFKEIEVVISDVVMAIVADVMLVYLPAPTIGLKPPLARNASAIAKFFSSCPDNAFQIALAGRSFTLVQRLGAFVRNAAKLLAVGTTASFIGTSVTNTVLKAKAAVNKDLEDEVVEIPVVQTSVAYGVYMSISSNLRYQLLAGVIEQRILEPLLHNQKLLLSAMSFIVRTGNTFLGSLLWIDYARWIGVQKAHDHEEA
ncbi:unnamed protein product [Miscanthus lutarioriparius]|uniref:Uncharacterized protein n=1 Tax=Miscanthus lutarioriparius TaxID=422564 RepID=A0A811P1B4_9POAL|nr:unnamed protein product [Miscanthus lutarioriparius]